jgi:signal transduction histidine kinase
MGTTALLAGALRRSLNVVAHPHVRNRVELTRLVDEQAALRRVATLVAQGAPPAQVFQAVSGEVGGLVGADAAGLRRYESDGTVTVLGYWARTGGDDIRVGTSVPLEQGTVGMLVFETRRPCRINAYEGAPGSTAALARQLQRRSTLGAPVIVEGRLWGFMSVASTGDRLFPLETEGRLAGFTDLVATAIANAENRKDLEWLATEQAALRRVATLVAGGAAPASLLAVVAAEVARVVHVWSVSIARYEDDGTATELASFSEQGELFTVGTHWSLEGTNVLAAVRKSGQPARIDDYSRPDGMIAQSVRRLGICSTVGIPIIVAGRLWGAMVVSSAEAEPLPETTEVRLADFTELVATAIANAESRAELDASRARIVAAADATRRRIERDLHDGVQQQLVSLALELRATHAAVPPELGELRAELSRAVERQTSVLEGLREIARGIHPAMLTEGGLGPALTTIAHRSMVPVELEVRVETRLPERVEVAAYYVVSEALANAAKYARASVVHVDVEVHGDVLSVSVRDDGEGGADPARGSGLLGLKDRAEAIGGTLSLESPPDAGTSLYVELPLADRATETQPGASSDAAPLASTRG